MPFLQDNSITPCHHLARIRFLILALLTIQCGLDIEDPTPPSPPVWVQKSLPEEWPERGIDAHESGAIFLEWEPNHPNENISEYQIYRAEYLDNMDSLGEFEFLYKVEINSGSSLEYLDTKCIPGVQYNYAIKAEDLAQNRSEYSDTLSYSLLDQISVYRMEPNGPLEPLSSGRALSWFYPYNIEMEDFYITILDQYNELIIRVHHMPENYIQGAEVWRIFDSIALEHNQLYKWRVDTGGKYSNGKETTGSESAWATFLYTQP